MTDQMTSLAAKAQLYKPRLFTIYGLVKNFEDPAFVGWGMDFAELRRTLYYEPDASETQPAKSPDQLMRFYQSFAEVRLEWLASR